MTTINNSQIYQAPLPSNAFIQEKSWGNKFAKALVRPFLLPASSSTFFSNVSGSSPHIKNFTQRLKEEKEKALNEEGAILVPFKTGDNATIEGMYFPSTHKRAILYVGGQNERYELGYKKMRDLKQQAGDPALFVFNPRGVGSKGDPDAETLAIDVYSAFRHLVDVQKIDPNDIVIFGHSLGGGYGAEGAKLVQAEYPDKKIQFVSHNSFRDLLSLLQKKLPKSLRKIIFPILEMLIKAAHWQLNSIDALRTLKGKKMIIVNPGDKMIRYEASLFEGVKQSDRPFDFIEYKMDPNEKHKDQHSRRFNAKEMSEVASHISKMFPYSKRVEVLSNLTQLEKALEQKNQANIAKALNSLEDLPKNWDWCSNMAHVLFKRIYHICGRSSQDPEFGRHAYNGHYAWVSNEKKLEVVRTLNKELETHWN